ncbi:MAG: 23S rRNA (uracil(1939)-C(5))-methyltransferase RlmD [Duodenibacillus sp.]|nr:23S rRNA (uracil(1939)-C(5))-methyltransferase RlmD [Duodenibacillus sp.]
MSHGKARAPKERPQFVSAVERLDGEGRGVAHRDGKVVFIEGALPGETVRWERVRNKPSWESGWVTEVLEESAMRVRPPCPHFGIGMGCCGGCAMQHLEPSAQVAFKQAALTDAFWHIGKLKPETLLAPLHGPYFRYRHRCRLTVRNVPKKGGVLVGFHEKRSSYVVDMQSCRILPQKISDMLLPMRALVEGLSIRDRMPQIEVAVDGAGRVALVFRVLEPPTEADLQLLSDFGDRWGACIWLQPKGPDSAEPMRPAERDALQLALPEFGVSTAFRPTDFTQVNPEMNEAMVGRAVRLLDVQPGDKVADFFCGLGNFTLPLATRGAYVTGLEGSEALVQRAFAGAAANGLAAKTDFVARNLFTWSEDDWQALWRRMGRIDRVLIDPPREGAQALAQVLAKTELLPRRVVYVSCNPATLARDCAILRHEGGWRIRAAGVMNMFPHTGHVESIAVLEKEPGAQVPPQPDAPYVRLGGACAPAAEACAAEGIPEDPASGDEAAPGQPAA